MQQQTYTHRDLAQLLRVSETTIKSYRSKFPTFLPVARQGKPVRLHQESLAVCRRIRELFADGLSILQTAERLKAEYKEYPQNRRLSIAQALPQVTAVLQGAEAQEKAFLALRVEELTQAQRQSAERMERLEAELRNLATLEAASKALVADLVAELRALRSQALAAGAAPQSAPGAVERPAAPDPPRVEAAAARPSPEERAAVSVDESAKDDGPTVLTARRIVSVHGQNGRVSSYALAREPKPEPLFPEPGAPEGAFLDLPVVIHSDRGDFLGLPGGQSVRRLVEMLSPEGAASATWFPESEEPPAWTCSIPLGRAQHREILFERTTTPRGNLVALIRRMRAGEAEATPVQLQEIFRQLRDQLA